MEEPIFTDRRVPIDIVIVEIRKVLQNGCTPYEQVQTIYH